MRAALPVLAVLACAPRDGQVGAAPPLDDAAAPDAAVLFASELGANVGAWDEVTPLEGARVTFGAANASAADGLVAELRFPGDPTLGAADRTDPNLATMIETRQYFRYGTFVARVEFPTCAPTRRRRQWQRHRRRAGARLPRAVRDAVLHRAHGLVRL
jgi:hypothetical protein